MFLGNVLKVHTVDRLTRRAGRRSKESLYEKEAIKGGISIRTEKKNESKPYRITVLFDTFSAKQGKMKRSSCG